MEIIFFICLAKFKTYEVRIYQNYHKTKEAAFEKSSLFKV